MILMIQMRRDQPELPVQFADLISNYFHANLGEFRVRRRQTMETFFNNVRSIARFEHENYHSLTAPQSPPRFESLLAEISCLCSVELATFGSAGEISLCKQSQLTRACDSWAAVEVKLRVVLGNLKTFHTKTHQTIEMETDRTQNDAKESNAIAETNWRLFLSSVVDHSNEDDSECFALFGQFLLLLAVVGESFHVKIIVIVEDVCSELKWLEVFDVATKNSWHFWVTTWKCSDLESREERSNNCPLGDSKERRRWRGDVSQLAICQHRRSWTSAKEFQSGRWRLSGSEIA